MNILDGMNSLTNTLAQRSSQNTLLANASDKQELLQPKQEMLSPEEAHQALMAKGFVADENSGLTQIDSLFQMQQLQNAAPLAVATQAPLEEENEGLSFNDVKGNIKDGLGTFSAGRNIYNAVQTARGVQTTSQVGKTLSLATGLGQLATSGRAMDVIKYSAGTAKNINSIAKGTQGVNAAVQLTEAGSTVANVSKLGKVSQLASKAAPVLGKACTAIGVVFGAIDIGQGIYNCSQGNTDKGKEQIVGGTCDIVTAGALAVAAGSSATVVGVPVAAVALGVAGVSQLVKYGYKYKDEIAQFASKAGDAIATTAGKVADKVGEVGSKVIDKVGEVGSKVVDKVGDVFSKGWDGLKSVFA